MSQRIQIPLYQHPQVLTALTAAFNLVSSVSSQGDFPGVGPDDNGCAGFYSPKPQYPLARPCCPVWMKEIPGALGQGAS